MSGTVRGEQNRPRYVPDCMPNSDTLACYVILVRPATDSSNLRKGIPIIPLLIHVWSVCQRS